MPVSPDTSGEALASAMRDLAARKRAPEPPPAALTGAEVQKLRETLDKLSALLARCAETREYRLRRDVLAARAEITDALRILRK